MSTAPLDISLRVARRHFDVEIELSIAAGEHLVLFGPSGAGKTTLLEAVAGLVRLDAGYVRLGGKVLSDAGPPYRSLRLSERGVGLVRQDPGLFPHLTVARNIAYARRLDPASSQVATIAAGLGLDGVLGAMPKTLSGGQRQRVALARVLMSDYSVLLLDEPYTGLDAHLQRELTRRAVAASVAVPSIMVTHDLDVAQSFGDRIGVIDRGLLLQLDNPHQVVLHPASRRVAELVGYLSFVPVPDGWLGIHPDRVVFGEEAARNAVAGDAVAGKGPSRERPAGGVGAGAALLRGEAVAVRPAGVLHEVEMSLAGATSEPVTVVFRTDHAVERGERIAVTAVEPPLFGDNDGAVTGSGGRRWQVG